MEDFDIDAFLESRNEEEVNCPVTGCAARYGGRRAAKRHWTSTHVPKITIFLCPIINCVYHNPRPNRIRQHIVKLHPRATSSKEQLAGMTKYLPFREENNRRYINPGIITPPPLLDFRPLPLNSTPHNFTRKTTTPPHHQLHPRQSWMDSTGRI